MVKDVKTAKTSSFVGIDLGHKAWHACRFSHAGDHEFFSGAMDARGIAKLSRWLKDGDKIAIESGSVSFWFKRAVEEKRQCTIFVLNAVQLKFIYNSLKKTDKEDSLKLARFIATNPEEALPIVRTPDTDAEYLRKLVRERAEIVRQMVRNKCRFYGLCIQAGITSVRKKDLRTTENIAEIAQKLPQRWQAFAQLMIEQQKLFQAQLAALDQQATAALDSHKEQAELLMSMPGIGPVTALALIAYTNGFKDFHGAGAVSAYVGLVPRIDHSGKTQRNGRIIQRCSTYLRGLLIQGAWSLVRCRDDNAIKAFYQRLALRVGSAKAIVATARKMVEVLYHMSLTETHFRPA